MNDSLQIRANVHSVIDETGAVLLDVPNGKYYSLNGVAAEIWRDLEAGRTPAEITVSLNARFGVATDIAQRDIEMFVSELVARQLVKANA